MTWSCSIFAAAVVCSNALLPTLAVEMLNTDDIFFGGKKGGQSGFLFFLIQRHIKCTARQPSLDFSTENTLKKRSASRQFIKKNSKMCNCGNRSSSTRFATNPQFYAAASRRQAGPAPAYTLPTAPFLAPATARLSAPAGRPQTRFQAEKGVARVRSTRGGRR